MFIEKSMRIVSFYHSCAVKADKEYSKQEFDEYLCMCEMGSYCSCFIFLSITYLDFYNHVILGAANSVMKVKV